MKKTILLITLFSIILYFFKYSKIENNNSISIVPYKQEYFQQVKNIFLDNWDWLVHDTTPDEYPLDESIEKEILSVDNPIKISTLLAVKDESLLGFIKYYEFTKDTARILFLITDKKERRKGIGRLLITKCIEDIKKKNYKYVYLITRKDNIRSQNLYKNIGFEEIMFKDDEENTSGTKIVHFLYTIK